jgi:FlaA1/EpsC-like NDP-sugar epimerase
LGATVHADTASPPPAAAGGGAAARPRATRAVASVGRSLSAVSRAAERLRGRDLFIVDLVAVAGAVYLALDARFDRLIGISILQAYFPVFLLPILIRPGVNARFGLYRRHWRFASVPDLAQIVLAVSIGTLLSVAVFYFVLVPLGIRGTVGFPRSFWLIEFLLALAFLGGVRFAVRALSEVDYHFTASAAERVPTLLYGAGRAGVLVARSATREPRAGIRPVGFLDDDPDLAGRTVFGLRVHGGLDRLSDAIAGTGARMLLITMPAAAGTAIRHVMDAGLAAGLEVRTVPSINDLLDGSVDAYRVRQVKVEDLLRRPIVTDHAAGVAELIHDQTVVITGAGGSIGSELARQVYALGPRRLILVDRAESPLYSIQRELETRRNRGSGSGDIRAHLANVASRAVMERLMRDEQPAIVFHAAAHKHVPMMEDHPSDAVQVNIGGTLALLDAAVAAGVPHFVLVSTDKAVRPSSVMGATKRVAEALVADTSRRTGRAFVSVRFGNVLGSTGSVVPIFQGQLEQGEPLTITDPAMTRFFMTIPEAGWLILDAAALGRAGDLFVLDMGEPVSIMDLARDLVRLSGRDPDSQRIEITGLRPGEKLHEELFYAAEEVAPTESAKVLRAVADPPPESILEEARRLLAIAAGETDDLLRAALFELVNRLERPAPIPAEEAPAQPVRHVQRPAVGRATGVAVPLRVAN